MVARYFLTPLSRARSQETDTSQMPMASPTPVQILALALCSVTSGEPGGSSRDGKTKGATSAGLKPSQWNSSSESFSSISLSQVSRFMGTTTESSRVGGPAEAETPKPIESSNEFTFYWKNAIQSSSPDMSILRGIQPTVRREESTPQETSSFPTSNSQKTSNPSSLISTHPSNPANELFLNAFLQTQNSSSHTQNGSGGYKRIAPPMTSQTPQRKRSRLIENLSRTLSSRK